MSPGRAAQLLGGGQGARLRIADRIERLIALLDALDGDVDREPEAEDDGDAEPEALSWVA